MKSSLKLDVSLTYLKSPAGKLYLTFLSQISSMFRFHIFYYHAHIYLHTIKSSLTFMYSRQHSQSLYLIPNISHCLLSCSY